MAIAHPHEARRERIQHGRVCVIQPGVPPKVSGERWKRLQELDGQLLGHGVDDVRHFVQELILVR